MFVETRKHSSNRLGLGTLLFLSILCCAMLTGRAWALPGSAPFVPGELLVKGKVGVPKTMLDSLLQGVGGREVEELPQLQVKRIKVPEPALEQIKAALAKNPAIEFVEENFLAEAAAVPNDTSYASQWHLTKIAAPQAWDISTGSSNVIIAVIDTGVDPTHPDLAAKLLPGYNFVSGNTDTHDVYGHGTSVAGAAAASSNNATGVASVAWDNPILPLMVSDASGYATYSSLAAATTYAVDHGAKVINISFGGPSSSSTLQSAVNYAWDKGAVIIASAGNSANSTPNFPAACSNVVAVAATTASDTLSSFSSYGSWVDVAAPGSNIYTTANGGSYRFANGTSFSSPITAGLAGLLWAASPALTNTDIVAILSQSADDLGTSGFDSTFGYGRINAYRALTLAQSFTPVVDTTAPTVSITAPAAGTTVTGRVNVTVSATDDVKVTKVELFVDGILAGTSTADPFNFSWDTTLFADSWHTLTAKAYDATGNIGETVGTSVYVSNPKAVIDVEAPEVAITSPYPGAKLGNSTTITVQGSDNVGVVKLELYIDGALKATKAGASLTWNWNTRKVKAGQHTLLAKAYDAAGNSTTDTVTVYK